jgi:hypothetical protein
VAVWQATFEFHSTAGFPSEYRDLLSAIAPPLSSWTPELEMWGTEQGDRIDVCLTNGRPSEARVRFDLRRPAEEFWLGIAQFVAAAGTSLESETGLKVPPRLAELKAALEGSRAARFVEDPARYFNRLRAGGLEDV